MSDWWKYVSRNLTGHASQERAPYLFICGGASHRARCAPIGWRWGGRPARAGPALATVSCREVRPNGDRQVPLKAFHLLASTMYAGQRRPDSHEITSRQHRPTSAQVAQVPSARAPQTYHVPSPKTQPEHARNSRTRARTRSSSLPIIRWNRRTSFESGRRKHRCNSFTG